MDQTTWVMQELSEASARSLEYDEEDPESEGWHLPGGDTQSAVISSLLDTGLESKDVRVAMVLVCCMLDRKKQEENEARRGSLHMV